jgi:hypothetical protein
MMRALIKLLKYSLFTMNVDKGVAMTSGNIIGSNYRTNKIPSYKLIAFVKLCEGNSNIVANLNVCNGCFFKFGVEVGVELSIVNALYRLRITDQLFKSYAFTRVVVRSQSTLQRLLRRQI